MKDILWRIEIWFKQHLTSVLADLNPGASESEIEMLEQKIGIQLPISFKEFYKWHNGQKGNTTGFFYGLTFMTLEEIFEQWKIWSEAVDDGVNQDNDDSKSYVPLQVKEVYANKKWIPFVHDWSGSHLGIDFDPGERGTAGQVINFGTDENVKFVLADDFESFLNWFITELESGNYKIGGNAGAPDFMIKKPETHHFLDSVKILYQGHL